MTIPELLHATHDAGLTIKLTGDKLKWTGNRTTVEKWLPVLCERKMEIVTYLRDSEKLDAESAFELFSERAAIMEFDGGLDHMDAEKAAFFAVLGRI